MEYTPRHPQPFTLAQARALDVPIIFEEIARLENSLVHLRRTQEELEAFVRDTADDDQEIHSALEENRTVMCVKWLAELAASVFRLKEIG
jgi:hypothetical protein